MVGDTPLDALSHPNYLVRLRGIDALVKRDPASGVPLKPGNPMFVEPLLGVANDPTKNVRAAAAWALGTIASTEPGSEAKNRIRSALPLVGVLNDPYLWVRANAARRLGALRDRRAVEPLIAQLHTKHRYMRREAARALGRIGDPRAIPDLADLHNRSTLDWIRASATEAIEEITSQVV